MPSQQVLQREQSQVEIQPGSIRVKRPETRADLVAMIERNNIQIIELKFTDLPGLWQHFSVALPEFNEDLFEDGIGFDGSSIHGFQEIHESDMLLKPDPATAFVDPVCEVPTLSIICDVADPVLGRPYSRDPRYVAKKAETYLKGSGIATTCYFGPELEFLIFDSIRFGQDQHCGYYYVESAEGEWNSGRTKAHTAVAISGTSRATRKATFRCPRTIRCRTSGPKSCWR